MAAGLGADACSGRRPPGPTRGGRQPPCAGIPASGARPWQPTAHARAAGAVCSGAGACPVQSTPTACVRVPEWVCACVRVRTLVCVCVWRTLVCVCAHAQRVLVDKAYCAKNSGCPDMQDAERPRCVRQRSPRALPRGAGLPSHSTLCALFVCVPGNQQRCCCFLA